MTRSDFRYPAFRRLTKRLSGFHPGFDVLKGIPKRLLSHLRQSPSTFSLGPGMLHLKSSMSLTCIVIFRAAVDLPHLKSTFCLLCLAIFCTAVDLMHLKSSLSLTCMVIFCAAVDLLYLKSSMSLTSLTCW
jgi:hypothetical protein